MRELGFSKKWPKLEQDTFTTFRFRRRDKDWQVGEIVRLVYKPRSKQREVLGVAKIIDKGKRNVDAGAAGGMPSTVTDKEAREDGFCDRFDMVTAMMKMHRDRNLTETMNKLTLVRCKDGTQSDKNAMS